MIFVLVIKSCGRTCSVISYQYEMDTFYTGTPAEMAALSGCSLGEGVIALHFGRMVEYEMVRKSAVSHYVDLLKIFTRNYVNLLKIFKHVNLSKMFFT